jgi:hypothetical protein
MLTATFIVTELFFCRGSLKDTEYYLNEGLKAAEHGRLGSVLNMFRLLKAHTDLRKREWQECLSGLETVHGVPREESSVELTKGEVFAAQQDNVTAIECYRKASERLEDLTWTSPPSRRSSIIGLTMNATSDEECGPLLHLKVGINSHMGYVLAREQQFEQSQRVFELASQAKLLGIPKVRIIIRVLPV